MGADGSSGSLSRKKLREPQGALQIPQLRSPEFPVETRGFDGLPAALFKESRTRGRRWQREVGSPGRDDKGKGVAQVGVVAG
jgi:hypothetical protein